MLGAPPERRLDTVSGEGSPGICDICGLPIDSGTGFVNIGPTDWTDPSKPKSRRWVPAGSDIHGWTPFVVEHPSCFVSINGQAALDDLRSHSA